MTNSSTDPKSSMADSSLVVPRSNYCQLKNAWAVILAGGDGLPRRSRIPSYLRGQRPSHFCRTANSDYVINRTREKVALAIPHARTIITVSENHLHYAEQVMGDVPPQNLIVEPQDDGSTFAVLYSVLRTREIDPNAIVVFFPSDLRVPDSRGFMTRVQDAIEAVQREPKLILLGVVPSTSDTDREWIKPDLSFPIHEDLNVWPVQSLRATVSQSEARELKKDGGLWDSSVMVGTISTFLRKIRRAKPEIYAAFKAASPKIGLPDEATAIRRIYYENPTESDFSRDVLQKSANQLAVIPVRAAKVKGAGRVSPEAARFLHTEFVFGASRAATALA